MQFKVKCHVQKPDDPVKKAHSQQKNNNDDESDVDKFKDDDDDVLDDEDCAVLEDTHKELDAEKDAIIEEESWDHQEILDLTDAEINTGVAALTKVCGLLNICIMPTDISITSQAWQTHFSQEHVAEGSSRSLQKKNIVILKMIHCIVTR